MGRGGKSASAVTTPTAGGQGGVGVAHPPRHPANCGSEMRPTVVDVSVVVLLLAAAGLGLALHRGSERAKADDLLTICGKVLRR